MGITKEGISGVIIMNNFIVEELVPYVSSLCHCDVREYHAYILSDDYENITLLYKAENPMYDYQVKIRLDDIIGLKWRDNVKLSLSEANGVTYGAQKKTIDKSTT
jgi:hypothetical protein